MILGIFIFFTPYFLTPEHPQEGFKKECIFKTESIVAVQNFYSNGLLYRGILENEGKTSTCSIFVKDSPNRPKANFSYQLSGILKQKDGHFIFKPKGSWKEYKKIIPIAEWRYEAKTFIKNHLRDCIKDKDAASFLIGIFTGELLDQEIRFNLSRLGLQHILAISGFHFALLSSLLFLPLKLVFRPKCATILILVLLTSYYLFIGPSPSVTRAWISSMLFFMGLVVERESSALNRLGVALLIIILINTESVLNLSFILSFSATLGLLLFHNPLSHVLEKYLKTISLEQALKLTFIDQLGLVLFSYLKKTFILTLSVNIIVLPILLFYFHSIPLLSFLYNLFIPLLIIPSMALLMLSLFIDLLVPNISYFIHSLNSLYTSLILKTTSDIPAVFHINYYNTSINIEALSLYVTLILFFGLLYQELTSTKVTPYDDRL